jgi:hypothetical protein
MSYSTTRARSARHTQPRLPQTFAAWSNQHAAALILPLGLNADNVAWINHVMQSSGEMDGIENITTLKRVLKQRRTKLRYPNERDFEKVLLAACVLFRAYENGVVS